MTLMRAVGALAGVGVAGVAYASLVERNAFALRRFSVPVLPAGSRPLRVLHLSDLHLMPGQRRKQAWLRGLAELSPDLVVGTGDFIADPSSVGPLVGALGPLLSVPGVFVLGSNDYFAPKVKNPALYLSRSHRKGLGTSRRLPTAELVAALTADGWLELSNERASLTVAGVPLEFVGVDDPHLHYDRYAEVSATADPAAALTVGVAHAPYQRVLDAMTADGAGLVLAGHTHGGQLAVPVYGALVTNCDLDTSRVKGVSRWWPGAGHSAPRGRLGWPRRVAHSTPPEAAWLHVSAGLGTSPYAPVRFACRPEATLLTLEPAAG